MIEIDNEKVLLGYVFFKFNFIFNNRVCSYNLSFKEDNKFSAFILKNLLNHSDIYISNLKFKNDVLIKAHNSNKFLGFKIEPISIILKNNYKKTYKEITEFQDIKDCSCYKNNLFLESDGKYNFFIIDDVHRYFYQDKTNIFPLYATSFLKSKSFIFSKSLFIYNSIYDKPIFNEPLVSMELLSFDDLFKIKNNIYKKNIQFFHNEEPMQSNKFKFYLRYSLLVAKCIYINFETKDIKKITIDDINIVEKMKKNEKYFISYFNPIKYFNTKSLDYNKFILECKYLGNKFIKYNKLNINAEKLNNVSYHPTYIDAQKATLFKIAQTMETIKPFLENSKALDIF